VDELRILSATGALGATPFNVDSFRRGLQRDPHMVGADAGSNDVGPYGLGANTCYFPREWVKHDLRELLLAARARGIPMAVGTAGHMGTDYGVDYHVSLIEEIAREESLEPFRLAKIYTEFDLATLREAVDAGDVEPLEGADPVTHETIDATTHAVAVIGVEPYVQAYEQGADVIIAGRSCDDAIFAAYPIHKGYDKALSIHLGKVLECASVSGTPYMARNTMMGVIREDAVLFEPMNPAQVCTPVSVAAHSMYEEMHPHAHRIPGGIVHLDGCQFEQVDARTVRVTGSRLEEVPMRMKLEGAGFVGYRFVGVVGVRDPLTISNLDTFLAFARKRVEDRYPNLESGRDYHLHVHPYGAGAIMEQRDDPDRRLPPEVGIVVEAIAPEEELARMICRLYRKTLMIAEYEGQKATTGKAAIMADEELRGMDAYRWTMYHTIRVESGLDHARLELMTIDARGER
jgi:hypothetical protein